MKNNITAIKWSYLDIILGQTLRFVITVILARILSPEDFGTVALVGIFTGVAEVFIDSGFGSALIQKRNITAKDISTVFWFNIIISLMFAVLLAMAATKIASFFSVLALERFIYIISISIVFNSIGLVPRTLLVKNMDFKKICSVTILSVLISGIIAITLAVLGFGIYSLAFQLLSNSFVNSLLLFKFSRIDPWAPISLNSGRNLLGFGGYLLASSLLEMIYSRSSALIIGFFYSAADLGQFGRAQSTSNLPTAVLTSSISRVAFPSLAQVSHDDALMCQNIRYGLQTTMFLNAPAMIGLAAIAEPFIAMLYGPAWLPSAPYLRLLCIANLFMPLHIFNIQALLAKGKSDVIFKLELIKKAIGILILFVASIYGPMGLCWGMLIHGFIAIYINGYLSHSVFGYGIFSQIKDIYQVVLVSFLMGNIVYCIISLDNDASSLTKVFEGILLGSIVYAAATVYFRVPGQDHYKSIFLNKLSILTRQILG